jgi:bacterioferritin
VVPEVADSGTSEGALKADLMLEERQLDHYRKRFAEANDLGLTDVGEALRPILDQTQEHVRDLQVALGL